MKPTRRPLFAASVMILTAITFVCLLISCSNPSFENSGKRNQPAVMLHELPPAYVSPYGIPSIDDIKLILERIRIYLSSTTYMAIVDSETGAEITDFSRPDSNAVLKRGDFPIISYEWGVTYGAMLSAAETTGDTMYIVYVKERLNYISSIERKYRLIEKDYPGVRSPIESVMHPRSLDDAGSMCAAMIKATRAGICTELRPMIENYIDFISNDEFRLNDGTFARRGPHPHTLWLDDLYMSVPALAQMGKLTGDSRYYDDAVRQIIQFTGRMFIPEKGLYMHGWAEEMETHPEFCWARANGWALLAMTELLDVLPADYKDRDRVIRILQNHIKGLAAYQSGSGFWHQLIDRNDSYLETSATAIYTYCIAHAINRGYIDVKSYGAIALLGWNALTTRINEQGQVEGTCVGTGMGFDPAFYYFRPQSALAAHGYGPAILAGSEIIKLLGAAKYAVEGGSVKFY